MTETTRTTRTVETVEITNEILLALRSEAASAGDMVQVHVCERALGGNEDARGFCQAVVAAAEARQDAS